MEDFSASGMGNYRRYLNPSLDEFDVNLMMEKATAISMNELRETNGRSGGNKDSFVVEIPGSGDGRGVQMFRQRAQVDTGGMFSKKLRYD
ncbi:Hypothetical predicted protein [Paramuricea clavata]|uniref:Uncharacterized protein n=1 Tax=Paramuricea clavata TaxID=317549 RepID=A0A7D9DXW5_PARCT|nr:Hypothetical predicted protein [Paramuricea clavata]